MSNDRSHRRIVRWWFVALLLATGIGAFLYLDWSRVRPRLEDWGILAPPWSSGKRTPSGEWEPKAFVPERAGPSLREIGRWKCWLVHDVAFFPDGQRLAVGAGVILPGKDWDGSGRSWCVLTVPDMKPTGQGGWGGACLDVSAKGDVAVETTRNEGGPGHYNRVEVYSPTSERPLFSVEVNCCPPGVRFTPDGSRLVVTTIDGHMKIWDVTEGKELANLKLTDSTLNCADLDISASNLALVATASLPPPLVDVLSLHVLDPPWVNGKFGPGWCVAVSSSGRLIGSVSAAQCCGAPMVYDRIGEKTLWLRDWVINDGPLGGREGVQALRFSPDGRLLAICGGHGHVGLFDAQDGTVYDQHHEFTPDACALRWSPDGTRLAACGNGGVVLYELVRPAGWK